MDPEAAELLSYYVPLYTSAGVFIVSSSRVKILKKQGSRYLIEASKLLFISIAPLALTKVAIPLFEES